MRKLLGLLTTVLLISCTTEPLAQEVEPPIKVQNQSNTFTVEWDSNQDGSTIEFTKHIFRDCKVVSSITEIHSEKHFDITLDNGQIFELQIKHTAPKKNPELYLAIYKDRELQYENEVNSNGFMLVSYVDNEGNISKN